MRSILLALVILLGTAAASMAQEGQNGDAAVTYHYVRTNAAPGQCGCFGLNGAGISGSWNVLGPWSAVAEFSTEYTSRATPGNSSLTLTTFLVGARYRLPVPNVRLIRRRRLQPFAQVLVGGGHSGGGVAGVGDATYAFAARIGGGIDVPISSRFSVRAIQIDYFPTLFANAKNDHQNNILIGAGIVYRWSRAR